MSTDRVSFFKNLLIRRVPQILGGYLAGGWIIVEFLDWLVKRYPISPHIVELGLVTLACMIPTVALLAYYHGKPGKDQWARVEKIGIPANLVITGLILFLIFRGQDLGATATPVTLIDEQGQQIERSVPKSEFRKKVAIFSLENESGDTNQNWLSHAIPDMVRYDLSQDMYMTVKTVYEFIEDARDKGYSEGLGIPLTLKKKIAEEQYMNNFITGEISSQGNDISIHLILFETKTIKTIEENIFTGEDIMAMVDDISVWIKKSLSIPLKHLENDPDLPASEILTDVIPAAECFYKGYSKCLIEEKWEPGLELLEQSVQYDSGFAYAYSQISLYNLINNRTGKAAEALQILINLLHKVPERYQFVIKHRYWFLVEQDNEMALEVAKTYAELYPDDIQAYHVLAFQYKIRNQLDKEIEAYKTILRLDPGQLDYLWYIMSIYRDQGKLDEALKYIQVFAEEFPGRAKSYAALGALHRLYFGEYETARNYYKKALSIEPDEIMYMLPLARINNDLGNFENALIGYHEILEKCKIPQERFEVYRALEDYHFIRGELSEAIEYLELRIGELKKYADQMTIIETRIFAIERYILAGKKDVAFQIAKDAEKLGPPLNVMGYLAYLRIYLELEEKDGIQKYTEILENHIDATQQEYIRNAIFWATGKLMELNGDYDAAIQHYADYLKISPTVILMNFHIGHCYRMMKNFRKAEEHLQIILEMWPYTPEEVFELGLVYADWGKTDQALEYVRRANSIWENADTTYALAMRARDKLAELEKTVN